MRNRIFVSSVIVLGICWLTILGVQPAHTQFGGGSASAPIRGTQRLIPDIGGPIGAPMRMGMVQSAEAAMASRSTWQFADVPLKDFVAKLRTTF